MTRNFGKPTFPEAYPIGLRYQLSLIVAEILYC
jgi:hypothetical protein